MWVTVVRSAAFLLFGGCAARSVAPESPGSASRPPAPAPEQAWLEELTTVWLARDTVPTLVVSTAPQRQGDGVLEVTVAPVRPEEQPWNAWPDGTARLFNDSAGYLWSVQVRSSRTVRWSPAHTLLAVNDSEQTFIPVAEPDTLLAPLLEGRRVETRAGGAQDLALRMRNADAFRSAYLPTAAQVGVQEGVVVFPAPTRTLQAVAMQLTMGFWVEGEGVRSYTFLFE